MPVAEGRKAPAFTLEDGRGNKVSLKDHLGKNVILYFYPRDDTPGCTKEACGFRDLWSLIKKQDAEFARVQMQAHLRKSAGHIKRSGVLNGEGRLVNNGEAIKT